MARTTSDQSIISMMSYPSAKNKRKNYSYSDIDEAIKKIDTGDISQAKAVHGYGIMYQTLERKCRNKRGKLA